MHQFLFSGSNFSIVKIVHVTFVLKTKWLGRYRRQKVLPTYIMNMENYKIEMGT